MGMQHDFNYSFEPKSSDITSVTIMDEMENRAYLDDLDSGACDVNVIDGKVYINCSFYSSYTYMNEVDSEMRSMIRKFAKPGTEADFYYNEVVTEHESFDIPKE